LLCYLRQILPSSPTASFSLLWRRLSLLYETRTTPRRVLNSRAVNQGQPRMKRGLCLSLVDAFELLSAADWNILISILNVGSRYQRVTTRLTPERLLALKEAPTIPSCTLWCMNGSYEARALVDVN
jgi:hypothetical protein